MMGFIFFVILPLAWSYGEAYSSGGGAFSYSDTSGNRYGGVYGLKDGQVVYSSGDPVPPVVPFSIPTVPFADTAYNPGGDFGDAYFGNLQNLLQEVFHSSIQNQRLAFDAAQKAYDLTSNQAAGYIPPISTRFPAFNNYAPPVFPAFGMPPIHNFPNSAFASAAAGPGYNQQIASIYPANPDNPNVNKINHYADSAPNNNGKFYSVSSKSFSSSSNVNGKEVTNRAAETMVNDNGRVIRYKVRS